MGLVFWSCGWCCFWGVVQVAVSWRVCYGGGIGRIGQIYDEILSPLVFRSRSFTFAQKTGQRLPVTPSRWDRQAAGGSSSHQVGLVAWSSPRHCSYRQGCHYSMAGRRRRRTEKKGSHRQSPTSTRRHQNLARQDAPSWKNGQDMHGSPAASCRVDLWGPLPWD